MDNEKEGLASKTKSCLVNVGFRRRIVFIPVDWNASKHTLCDGLKQKDKMTI